MIRALIPALALALLASPAVAQDPRLVEVMYDETKVVRIDGRVAVQASIMFGDDEVIENVAIGDSATWQVTPNKRANILFVKPLEPRVSTNLTVRHQQTHLPVRSCRQPRCQAPLPDALRLSRRTGG